MAIAAKKGLFKRGLESVEIVNFTPMPISTQHCRRSAQLRQYRHHTAMNSSRRPADKDRYADDISQRPPRHISDGSVTEIKDLKGKEVAYEEGTPATPAQLRARPPWHDRGRHPKYRCRLPTRLSA